MDAPAGSDPSGGKRKTKPRRLTSKLTPLELEDANNDLSTGVLTLDKPSGVPNAPNWERQVCLDLTDPSDKYRQSLYCCISKFKYADEVPDLQNVIRQVIEGIEELRLNNLYHGNLSIYTTYYDTESKLVKLANFKEKGDSQDLIEVQFGDWHGFGNMCEDISTVAQRRFFNLTYLLDDLARQLKSLAPPKKLSQVKGETLNHVFFWDRDRSSFYTYGILGALHQDDFKTMVDKLDFIPKDWNKKATTLLAAMNRYRAKNGGKDYTGGRHHYVVYVSGAYTHEEELGIDVDKMIQVESPLLCLELVRIVRQLGYNNV